MEPAGALVCHLEPHASLGVSFAGLIVCPVTTCVSLACNGLHNPGSPPQPFLDRGDRVPGAAARAWAARIGGNEDNSHALVVGRLKRASVEWPTVQMARQAQTEVEIRTRQRSGELRARGGQAEPT